MKNMSSHFISKCFSWKTSISICFSLKNGHQHLNKLYIERLFHETTGHEIACREVCSWNNRPSNFISRGFLHKKTAVTFHIDVFFMKNRPSNFISSVFFMKEPAIKYYIERFFHGTTGIKLYIERFFHEKLYIEWFSHEKQQWIFISRGCFIKKHPIKFISKCFFMKKRPSNFITRSLFKRESGHQIIYREVLMLGALQGAQKCGLIISTHSTGMGGALTKRILSALKAACKDP